jgi:hypothetical protein
LQEFQRSERPARSRDLVPEDRRERQGAVRQAVDEERHHQRVRQQQPSARQHPERRQLMPPDRGNNRAARGEHLVRPRHIPSEDRRERRGAVRQAVQEEDQRNHRRARQQ